MKIYDLYSLVLSMAMDRDTHPDDRSQLASLLLRLAAEMRPEKRLGGINRTPEFVAMESLVCTAIDHRTSAAE